MQKCIFSALKIFYIKDRTMLEDLKVPVDELKENIMDVWGRL